MRKLALALAVVAAFGATGAMAAGTTMATTTHASVPAVVAPLTATGAITAIDLKAHTVTIDKVVYHFSKKSNLTKLKVGENVTVTYKVVNKLDWVTKITMAKA
ncbi:MAG: hypothetical protein ABI697_07695 [Devosia sp.]